MEKEINKKANKTSQKSIKAKQKKVNENNNKNNNQSKKKDFSSKKTNNQPSTKKDNKDKKIQKTIENVENLEQEIEIKEEVNEEIIVDKKQVENEPVEEEKTNKIGLIIIIAILLAVVGICIFYQVDNKNKDNNSEVSSEESNEIMDNFYKYFNSKKTKIIYYASSTCGYCSLETPIMEQIAKDYDIDYLHIDSSKLTNSDREKMLKELNIEQATPTTIIVKNGEVIDTQVGYVDGGQMVEYLIENKILEKDAVYTPEQYITFINYEEYNNLLKEEGKHVVTIGQTGCSHCIATKPVINSIAKDYDITIYYLNLTEMSQTENTSFVNSLSEIGYDEEEFVSNGKFGTPLTLIIENGKVVSYINGERPTAQFIRALKKSNVITE